jgi:hypothetical protein
MPVRTEWTDDDINSLAKTVSLLESNVNQGTRDIASIKGTLMEMQSAEMAELRRRADFPRRLLYAVGAPFLAAVCSGGILLLAAGIH